MDTNPQSCNHDHVVQFYKTDAFLAEVVCPFIAAGLRRGGTALIVCTIEHRSVISAAMRSAEIDVEKLKRRKVLVWLDARSLRERLRSDDPNAVFQREIGSTVKQLDRQGAGKPVHIFGELVDLLWAEGKHKETVELENMWNALARTRNFNLLCAYKVSPSRSSKALRAVCTAHSHVLRPERAGAVHVLDEARSHSSVHGEREMVFASRRRDQALADGLREDQAQTLFGLILQCQRITAHAPSTLRQELDVLILRLERLLELVMEVADDLAPVTLKWSSLPVAVEKYAAMTERLFGVSCEVVAPESFVEPDRIRRELLYAIVREVVDRAARRGGSRQIKIKLSRYRAQKKLAIYHDGDGLVAMGAEDDAFRRLVYQSRALGAKLDVGPRPRSNLQLACRW